MRKLFSEYAERYRARDGGYTRILRTRRRKNDSAQMAFIEYAPHGFPCKPSLPATLEGKPPLLMSTVPSEHPHTTLKVYFLLFLKP